MSIAILVPLSRLGYLTVTASGEESSVLISFSGSKGNPSSKVLFSIVTLATFSKKRGWLFQWNGSKFAVGHHDVVAEQQSIG